MKLDFSDRHVVPNYATCRQGTIRYDDLTREVDALKVTLDSAEEALNLKSKSCNSCPFWETYYLGEDRRFYLSEDSGTEDKRPVDRFQSDLG
jgi:hypothetical protein